MKYLKASLQLNKNTYLGMKYAKKSTHTNRRIE